MSQKFLIAVLSGAFLLSGSAYAQPLSDPARATTVKSSKSNTSDRQLGKPSKKGKGGAAGLAVSDEGASGPKPKKKSIK
jgi:hypothetical protein